MTRLYTISILTITLLFTVLAFIFISAGQLLYSDELAFTHCDASREHCNLDILDVEQGVIISRPLEGTPFELGWSPEGTRLLISQLTMDGVWTYLYDTDGSISRFGPLVFTNSWLSENRLMVQINVTEFRVYDFLSNTYEPTIYTVAEGYNEVFFAQLSPNGQYYAASPMSGDASGTLQIASVNGDGETLQINSLTTPQNFDWSPDSQQIIYTPSSDNLDIYVTTLATGETRPLATSEDHEYSGRWSHDGSRIAFLVTDINFATYHINILNVTDGSIYSIDIKARSGMQISFIEAIEWSPDDRYLLVQPFIAGTIGGFYLVSTDGTDSIRRITATESYNFPVWRP